MCREHLDKLLAEEAAALTRLEGLLDQEHEFLVANDIDQLERASEARQNCVTELLRVEDERRGLCRMLNYSADQFGLEKLFTWCDPSKQLHAKLAASADRATRCRSLNDRNGALVNARMKRVEGLLGVITGRASQPKVYGRTGAYQTVATVSRLNATV